MGHELLRLSDGTGIERDQTSGSVRERSTEVVPQPERPPVRSVRRRGGSHPIGRVPHEGAHRTVDQGPDPQQVIGKVKMRSR
jgi:hypothetical protein